MRKTVVIVAIALSSMGIGGGIANAQDIPEKKVGALFMGNDHNGNEIWYDKEETQIGDFDDDGFFTHNPYDQN